MRLLSAPAAAHHTLSRFKAHVLDRCSLVIWSVNGMGCRTGLKGCESVDRNPRGSAFSTCSCTPHYQELHANVTCTDCTDYMYTTRRMAGVFSASYRMLNDVEDVEIQEGCVNMSNLRATAFSTSSCTPHLQQIACTRQCGYGIWLSKDMQLLNGTRTLAGGNLRKHIHKDETRYRTVQGSSKQNSAILL